jgi:hypothetical protein
MSEYPELYVKYIIILYEDNEGKKYSSIKNNQTKHTTHVRGAKKLTTLLFNILKFLNKDNS